MTGDHRTALIHYLELMAGVAELRAGWGWRDAQAYFVDNHNQPEAAAFRVAHQLQDLDALAELLDLSSRTALRRILRGGVQPDDLDGAGMQEIVDVLGSIAARENAEDGASAAELMPAYERLEALVSLRFRLTMQSASAASTHDVRPWAVQWDAHVLQLRVLADGETVHVAGL